MKEKENFRSIVKAALTEDIGSGDITTDPIMDSAVQAHGTFTAKQEGILCGIEIAHMVFEELDKDIRFTTKLPDGAQMSPGVEIAVVSGPADVCLKAERTALNFLQHLSGIATLTRRFVEKTQGSITILDTRKTHPGLRIMEKYAVRVGGGQNHRYGLYDMVLIKDNHIKIAGSITTAVEKIRKHHEEAFIEVEVKTLEELKEAVSLKINRLMLDNMDMDQIREAVAIVRSNNKDIEIEISGGINLKNIAEYAGCGVDYISIGALTHSAPAIDIAMKMKSPNQVV